MLTRQEKQAFWVRQTKLFALWPAKKTNLKFYLLYLKIRFFFTHKASIHFMTFFVTNKCTLNCKGCDLFVPEYDTEHKFMLSFAEFKTDLDYLLTQIDLLQAISIVGGEPLLCPDFPHMLEYAESKRQIKGIQVYTNGTILPSDALLHTLKKSRKIVFTISNYINTPAAKVRKIRAVEIADILQKNKIPYILRGPDQYWNVMPSLYIDNDRTSEDLQNQYVNCWRVGIKGGGVCPICADGKFYLCPLGGLAAKMHKDYQLRGDDYVNIREKDAREQFVRLIIKPYLHLCSLCHYIEVGEDRASVRIPVAEQI
jgi:organic radical activating enzyme